MSLRLQVTFWILALAILIAAVWLLKGILLPFIAGMVLAYFLDPVADGLERLGLPRLAVALIIVGASILTFILVLLFFLPILVDQVAKFAERLPGYVTTLASHVDRAAPDWLKQMIEEGAGGSSAANLAGRAAGWIGTVLGSLWSGGVALLNLISLLVVTPVVAFYLIKDWDRMVAAVDSWLPIEHADTIRELARQIDVAIAGFIRGQGTVCLILGTIYAVGLTAVGLHFGFLIGLTAGLLSFIPFLGTISGAVLSLAMALVQFWPDWLSILLVATVFVIGQFIEGNFLSPKLVGDRVGLHPVWLMFALFAFGYLFGFVGLLLAVPLAAAAGVLCRFALKQYLGSRLYLGVAEAEPPIAGPGGPLER